MNLADVHSKIPILCCSRYLEHPNKRKKNKKKKQEIKVHFRMIIYCPVIFIPWDIQGTCKQVVLLLNLLYKTYFFLISYMFLIKNSDVRLGTDRD